MKRHDLLTAERVMELMPELHAGRSVSAGSRSQIYRTDKIPFAFNYADKDLRVTHDDCAGAGSGHGSHAAGTVCADRYIPDKDGGWIDALETAHTAGSAPDAQLIVMKVFGTKDGTYDSEYMAAVEDAVVLGCDTIVLSLGDAAPGAVTSLYYRNAFDRLADTDIVMVVSAGDGGHWAQRDATPAHLPYGDEVQFQTIGGLGSSAAPLTAASSSSVGEAKMSSFSSWGVPGDLSLKPEITAPGENIYSAEGVHCENGKPQGGRQNYRSMSGTSIAAAQVAGAAAVVRQAVDEKSKDLKGLTERALTQSLLMSTAVPIRGENGVCASVFQQGSGLVDANAAVTAPSYILVDGQPDGKVKAELGDDPGKKGRYTFSFTVNDLIGADMEYILSAEIFTQGEKIVGGDRYLDTETVPLPASVRYSVEHAEEELMPCLIPDEYDFNDDHRTDRLDAQALMDSIIKGTPLTKSGDIDGDGSVDTYDVHLLLRYLSSASVVVPANGSLRVTVTIELDDKTKDRYVEGFIFAEPKAAAEGVQYPAHSIPVLAYCGNWTDPTMFDVGSYIDSIYGLEPRTPHTAGKNGTWANSLFISRDGSDTLFPFGGDPYYDDGAYYPERNAINSQNTMISKLSFCNVRDAAASRVEIRGKDGTLYAAYDLGFQPAAFGAESETDGNWTHAAPKIIPLNWKGTDQHGRALAEHTKVEIRLSLAPEKYADGQAVRWDELGEGAHMTYPITIDNTAPRMISAERTPDNELVVKIQDDQYIAAVELYSSDGSELLAHQVPRQTASGQELTVTFDAAQLVGTSFKLALADYARNEAVFDVGEDAGPHEPKAAFYHFYAHDDRGLWYGVDKDRTESSIICGSDSGARYTAGAYVGGRVFTFRGDVRDQKQLLVMDGDDLSRSSLVGCYPPSDGMQDDRFYVSDMAYSTADEQMYLLWYTEEDSMTVPRFGSVDLLTGDMAELGEMTLDIPLMTCDHGGNFYGIGGDAAGKTLYRWTADTWRTPRQIAHIQYPEELGAMTISTGGALAWDADKGCLVQLFSIAGAGGDTVGMVDIDPESGTAANFWTGDGISAREVSALYITDAEDLYDLDGDGRTDAADAAVLDSSIQNGTTDTLLNDKVDMDRNGRIDDADLQCLEKYIRNMLGDPFAAVSQTPKVEVFPGSLNMAVGGSARLGSRVTPWCLDDTTVHWSVSPQGIADVSPDGVVTALSAGECDVIAVANADGRTCAKCHVTVRHIDAAFDALVWTDDGKIWWSGSRTGETGTSGELVYHPISAAQNRLSHVFKTSDGRLYAVDLDTDTQTSSLYTIDPATREETKLCDILAPAGQGDRPIGAMDICCAPSMGADGGECALAVYGPYIYRLDLDTGAVTDLIQFTDGAELIGIDYVDTFQGAYTGVTYDRFLVIAGDGSVYLTSISLDEQGMLDSVSANVNDRVAQVGIGPSPVFSDACYAKAGDGLPYLFWTQFDERSSTVELMALSVDLEDRTSSLFKLGRYPRSVWAVGGLIPKDPADAALDDEAVVVPWEQAAEPGLPTPGYPLQQEEVSANEGEVPASDEAHQRRHPGFERLGTIDQPLGAYAAYRHGCRTCSAPEETAGQPAQSFELQDLGGKKIQPPHRRTGAAQQRPPVSGRGGDTGIVFGESSFDSGSRTFTVQVAAGQAATNGRASVWYDPDVLTFVGAEGSTDVFACMARKGEVEIGLASAREIGSKETVGTLRFSCTGGASVTVLEVTTSEIGDASVSARDRLTLTTPTEPDVPVIPAPGPGDAPITEPAEPIRPGYGHFRDLPADGWYREAVEFVLEKGLMSGTADDTFAPDGLLSRAMLVTILHRVEKEPTADVHAFADVRQGQWYSDAVCWASSADIIKGYSDGRFGPEDDITREQLAAILYRYAAYRGMDVSAAGYVMPDLADRDEISDWADPAVSWCVKTGILTGRGENCLEPQGKATRAEAAAMLMRAMELEPGGGMQYK